MPAARTILVTGANRGLGHATALRLAAAGHRLILTARSEAKARGAAERVRAEVSGAAVDARVVDLASLASVRALATRLVDDDERVDVLVHDAGILFPPERRELTGDGIEVCLQVHAVAPMLLTRLLLPVLARPSRVWAVGSALHEPGSRGAEVDFRHDDPNLDARYHPQRAYKNSKLAVLWVAHELERRLGSAGIHADVVSPGFVPTTAAAGARTGLQRFGLRWILPRMPFATSLEEAAEGLARLFGQAPLAEAGGRYFKRWQVAQPSEQARDGDQAARFWRWACERAGVPEAIELPGDDRG